MDKIIITSKDDLRDAFMKEGIYMYMDHDYDITTRDFSYCFIKSQYC